MIYKSVVEAITDRLQRIDAEGVRKIIGIDRETVEILRSAYKQYLDEFNRLKKVCDGFGEQLTIEEFAVSENWAFILKKGDLVKVWFERNMRYGRVMGPDRDWHYVLIQIPNFGCQRYEIEKVQECDLPQDIIDMAKKGGAK